VRAKREGKKGQNPIQCIVYLVFLLNFYSIAIETNNQGIEFWIIFLNYNL
jgi:hypothetical protein